MSYRIEAVLIIDDDNLDGFINEVVDATTIERMLITDIDEEEVA